MENLSTYGFPLHLLKLCLGRCSYNPHDMQQLVLIISAAEEWKARNHFGKYTATGPDVNGGAICT